MKNIFLAIIAISILSSSKPSLTIYDLKTAIEKNMVSCAFNGNFESPHYYQPLNIEITNLTNKEISIKVPNGLKFISDSTDIQDVIITQEELIALTPSQKETKSLFAMCIQQNNSAPFEGATYHIGNLATGNLNKLTHEIEKNKTFNTLGQYSIWALTNKHPLEEIDGFDKKEATHYQKYIANLLNIKPPVKQPENYKTYYERTTTISRSVEGNFKYKIHNQSNVTIGLFNEQDIIVRELYNNPSKKPGYHHFKYAFDLETYQDPRYYVRLIIDGKIKVNLKIEPRKS